MITAQAAINIPIYIQPQTVAIGTERLTFICNDAKNVSFFGLPVIGCGRLFPLNRTKSVVFANEIEQFMRGKKVLISFAM
ncbi:hypothetical protein D3C86_1604820 [compost metagenome]